MHRAKSGTVTRSFRPRSATKSRTTSRSNSPLVLPAAGRPEGTVVGEAFEIQGPSRGVRTPLNLTRTPNPRGVFTPSNPYEEALGRSFNPLSLEDRLGGNVGDALRYYESLGNPLQAGVLDDPSLADPATVEAALSAFQVTNSDVGRANELKIPLGELLSAPNVGDFLDTRQALQEPTPATPAIDQNFINTLTGPLLDSNRQLTDRITELEDQLSGGGDQAISNQILFQLLNLAGGNGQQQDENQFTGGVFYPNGNPFTAS